MLARKLALILNGGSDCDSEGEPLEDFVTYNMVHFKCLRKILKQKNRASMSSVKDELESSEDQADALVNDDGPLSNDVGENYFNYLSDEVILRIFYWIPTRFFGKVGLVCHRFNRLIQDESLWTKLDISGRTVSDEYFWKIFSKRVITLKATACKVHVLSSSPPLSPDFKERLYHLDLTWTNISKPSLVALFSQCLQIKTLSLARVPVSDEVFMAISVNEDLEVLNLTHCFGIKEEGLKCLLTNCRKLRELNMAETGLSSMSVSYLCNNLPSSMNRLSIADSAELKDNNVASLVRSCPYLHDLDLSNCEELTIAVYDQLMNLKELNFLVLSPDFQLPFPSLSALKNINSLSYLNVNYGTLKDEDRIQLQNTLGSKVIINKKKFWPSSIEQLEHEATNLFMKMSKEEFKKYKQAVADESGPSSAGN